MYSTYMYMYITCRPQSVTLSLGSPFHPVLYGDQTSSSKLSGPPPLMKHPYWLFSSLGLSPVAISHGETPDTQGVLEAVSYWPSLP